MKQGNSERWKPVAEVHIPPIAREGYGENVLQRDIWDVSVPPESTPAEAYLIRCATNERIDLYKADFIIGKSRDADYKIEGNAAISRKHVRIIKTGGAYILEDMGSLNHTYVDEVMVNGATEIVSGQLIKLADEAFAFFVEKVEK